MFTLARGSGQRAPIAEDLPAPLAASRQAARKATVRPGEALRRGRLLQAIIGGGIIGFGALLALVDAKRSAAIDLRATRTLQRLKDPRVVQLMRVASWPGFPPQSRVIPPSIAGVWLLLGFPVEAAGQVLAWGSAVLATAAKHVANRERPVAPQVEVVLAPLGGTSFPSGHVLSYVGTYGFLAYLMATRVREPAPRAVALTLPVGLIALVGPSRIYQGHHWLTDVLASYMLGAAYVAGLVVLYRRMLARWTPGRDGRRPGATGDAATHVDR
jgi:membrane-associated phospholipid phosphatase